MIWKGWCYTKAWYYTRWWYYRPDIEGVVLYQRMILYQVVRWYYTKGWYYTLWYCTG